MRVLMTANRNRLDQRLMESMHRCGGPAGRVLREISLARDIPESPGGLADAPGKPLASSETRSASKNEI
jgi:hypothetical protein